MAFDEGPIRHHEAGGSGRSRRRESAREQMARDIERAERNDHLRDHLTEKEIIRLATRQHRIVLWKPVLALVVALGLMVRALRDSEAESARGFFVVVLAAALIWLGYRIWWWSRHLFVATDKRILKTYGVLSTQVDSMRNTKVTDMKYRRTFVGEVLGFGEITVESAGQDQALRHITYLPLPRENYQELSHIILGEKPRSGGRKPNRFGRRLKKMARRRADPKSAYEIGFPNEWDHDDHHHDHFDDDHLDEARGNPNPRVLYSSSDVREAQTSPIPIYPPGHFAGRDDDNGEEDYHDDPTRN